MRFKKGFTLAEILIVLMVIGVIATLTIPSLMKGVTEAQYKTAYKKAYNAVVNITAMEKISGALPSNSTEKEATKMWEALNSSLSVKEYSLAAISGAGTAQNTTVYYAGVKYKNSNDTANQIAGLAEEDGLLSSTSDRYPVVKSSGEAENQEAVWIVSEDNLAYAVITGGADEDTDAVCGTKAAINIQKTNTKAFDKSCAVVVADVNGLAKGPNRLDDQVVYGVGVSAETSEGGELAEAEDSQGKQMAQLTGDRYYIYVGIDGATAGNKNSIVTGRIVSDIK